jgi:hypothetical protein
LTFPREIALADVLAMLEQCAPGYTIKRGEHRDPVTWKGVCFHLPHGKSKADRRIETGFVRKLVRTLNIPRDCVRERLPSLAGCFPDV